MYKKGNLRPALNNMLESLDLSKASNYAASGAWSFTTQSNFNFDKSLNI
jgi:hypothetical protein